MLDEKNRAKEKKDREEEQEISKKWGVGWKASLRS